LPLSEPRTALTKEARGEPPEKWPGAGDLPSEEEGEKRRQPRRSSELPREMVREGEKGVASGFRAEPR
jgi:hypothetical protein